MKYTEGFLIAAMTLKLQSALSESTSGGILYPLPTYHSGSWILKTVGEGHVHSAQ